MVTHMKTTVEISDQTLEEAKRVAVREGTTLRALLEDGLRRVLAEHRARRAGFRLRKVTFSGNGLSPEFSGAGWGEVRDVVYRERGA
jgi:hypothetical protein